MRRWFTSLVLSAAVAGVGFSYTPAYGQASPPAVAPAAKGTDLPVRAVVLFSSGVGYFEHFGTVNGNGSTELRFKTQQINDILKSLVLEDTSGGKVTAITYPSLDPVSKILRSFQVNITDNPSMGDLLNQLRGAKVKIVVDSNPPQEGTILGLEKRPKAVGDKTSIEVWYLNLIKGADLSSVELGSVRQIDLEDPELQDEMHKALAALAQSRDQDKKPVTINFTGQGARNVRIGYVVETPVWKTSYRLLLDDKAAAAADTQPKPVIGASVAPAAPGGQLQGWAIIENQTDNDWNNIELSLVSGRPISFIQDLYQPLYIPRPVVQPELFASLKPQTYEGGMEQAKQVERFGMAAAPGAAPMSARAQALKRDGQDRDGGRGAPGMAGEALADEAESANKGANQDALCAINASASVASVASAAKIGELFQYTVGNVSLPRQRSAMIPIITDPINVQRLSIYNQNVLPRNPLTGALLKNTTKKHLLAGPVTVFDNGSYAGDARIDNVPPGQERLISYGVDLQIVVDATKKENTTAITSGKIIKGILFLNRRNVMTQDYTAENKGEKDKTLVIEHPLHPGWKLLALPEGKDASEFTAKPYETTDTLYRFKGTVPAGKVSKLVVSEDQTLSETMAILPADIGQLSFYTRSGEIPQNVKDALGKAIQLKSSLTDSERAMGEKQRQLSAITDEQNRIREDMKTVDKTTQYYTRLMTKLNDQETQIEKLQGDLDGLRKEMDQQRKALEDYLLNLNVQ